MLNLQFKILLLTAVIVSFNQADKILFQDCSKKILPLLEKCHEKAEVLEINCDLLRELERLITLAAPLENLSSQVAIEEITKDIAHTKCSMPAPIEPIMPFLSTTITRLLYLLVDGTVRSARIISMENDPHIAEYQHKITSIANITQQFIDLPFRTEIQERKGVRCIIANLIWQFGELRPVSKKLIKNSQG